MTTAVTALVWVCTGYFLVGAIFGLFFTFRLVGKLDANAQQGTWGFRLLIWPGAAALWPFLLLQLVRGRSLPDEDNAHRQAVADREVA